MYSKKCWLHCCNRETIIIKYNLLIHVLIGNKQYTNIPTTLNLKSIHEISSHFTLIVNSSSVFNQWTKTKASLTRKCFLCDASRLFLWFSSNKWPFFFLLRRIIWWSGNTILYLIRWIWFEVVKNTHFTFKCFRSSTSSLKQHEIILLLWNSICNIICCSALICFSHSSAVGVGFYGNSETNDGVYQLTYSIYNANHTLHGIGSLVRVSLPSLVTHHVIPFR